MTGKVDRVPYTAVGRTLLISSTERTFANDVKMS